MLSILACLWTTTIAITLTNGRLTHGKIVGGLDLVGAWMYNIACDVQHVVDRPVVTLRMIRKILQQDRMTVGQGEIIWAPRADNYCRFWTVLTWS